MRFPLITWAVAALSLSCSFGDVAETVHAKYPYLCSGAMRDAELAGLPEGVIAQCESITVTAADLDAQIGKLTGSTRDQARRYPVYALERYITNQLMLVEAKEWTKNNKWTASSDDQLITSYLTAHTPKFEATEKEAEDFYKEHANLFGGSAYEQVRTTVIYYVRDEKTATAEDHFTSSAGKRHKILVSDAWMGSEYKRWARNPVEQARVSGRPTYVNFGVIGCCDKMNPVTQALRTEYGERLNVVFVHVGEEEVLSYLYGIKTIPVQFLFDKDGRLLLRHEGFMSKEQVLAGFSEGGIDLSKGRDSE